MRQLPNILTASRLASAPVVAGLLLWAHALTFQSGAAAASVALWAAVSLYGCAALSDALDGALARRWGVTSPLGAALDHAADKTLVAAGLMAYAASWAPMDLVIASLIIVARDLAVAGLREGLSLSGRPLPVNSLGKLKTVAEMAGLAAALTLVAVELTPWDADWTSWPSQLAAGLEAAARFGLWAAAALAVITFAIYMTTALRPTAAPAAD